MRPASKWPPPSPTASAAAERFPAPSARHSKLNCAGDVDSLAAPTPSGLTAKYNPSELDDEEVSAELVVLQEVATRLALENAARTRKLGFLQTERVNDRAEELKKGCGPPAAASRHCWFSISARPAIAAASNCCSAAPPAPPALTPLTHSPPNRPAGPPAPVLCIHRLMGSWKELNSRLRMKGAEVKLAKRKEWLEAQWGEKEWRFLRSDGKRYAQWVPPGETEPCGVTFDAICKWRARKARARARARCTECVCAHHGMCAATLASASAASCP